MGKKNKKKSSEKQFQRHFRRFHDKKTTGHPSYVYDEKGNMYLFIGITGAPTTNGIDNIPLSKNPEPGNKTAAYLRPKGDVIANGTKGKKLKGWKFANGDKVKVQFVIDKTRKKK